MAQEKKKITIKVPYLSNREGVVEDEVVSYIPSEASETRKKRLLSQYVYVYLLNQRQGTRKSKTRSEVKGTTKKVYRQKGTGRARHGDKKAPIFVGGGIAHGPKLNIYSKKLTVKQKKLAMKYVLEFILKEKRIVFLNEKKVEKTKEASKIIGNLGDPRALVIVSGSDSLVKGFRNLSGVVLVHESEVNPYNLLLKPKVICMKDAWKKLSSYLT